MFYLLSGFFFLFCTFFVFLNHRRKKRILQKLCRMDACEKQRLLDELAAPFGFFYLCPEDIMSSLFDGWQHDYGYRALFDQAAPRFYMVFDCEPIYFSYQGRTWLIEFWKGQYGINVGAEIGVYQADTLIPRDQRASAVFHSVPDEDFLPLSMELFLKEESLFAVRQRHWWLTGFRMGSFAGPEKLRMNCAVSFPNRCMLRSFLEGMEEAGYSPCELLIRGLTVMFAFDTPHAPQPRADHPWLTRKALFVNRLLCKLYRRVTRPVSGTRDQLLYLYYFLPAALRRILTIRRMPKI